MLTKFFIIKTFILEASNSGFFIWFHQFLPTFILLIGLAHLTLLHEDMGWPDNTESEITSRKKLVDFPSQPVPYKQPVDLIEFLSLIH